MGEWQKTNDLTDADKLFLKEFEEEKASFTNLKIAGFQWYKYSTMQR